MLIEVKGVQFVNKGAELMLHAVLQQLQQHWPNAQLVLAPNPNSPYVARARLAALQRVPLRKGRIDLNRFSRFIPKPVRRWLRNNLGLVFAADIDVVLDASGFAYGDQWPQANSAFLSAELRHFAAMGKPYILLPQALGPFSRAAERQQLKQALPLAALICAREQSSLQHVRDLTGDIDQLVRFGDFTNLVQGVLPAYYSEGQRKVLIIPNANMVSARNQRIEWQPHYLPLLHSAVKVIRQLGLEPVLLNHEGDADGAICQSVQQHDSSIEIINEADPLKVKGIIGASKAVICSRFHGCVSALSQGVPCLGTSWSHKYERLFDEYGQSEALLSADTTSEQLLQKLQWAINNIDNPQLAEKRAVLKLQSEQLWQQVEAVINQKLNI
ncbi:MAG TPA: polysaccharide pyruvyl transferase family protein [Rheinheimera sp.]|uniref:polysaccharide pyruvyl transferase family protein n=1 Tax=Rheinheimera sp. TaxID=1869214 RepID=UPI002F949E9D